jgi:hypothetical protein
MALGFRLSVTATLVIRSIHQLAEVAHRLPRITVVMECSPF